MIPARQINPRTFKTACCPMYEPEAPTRQNASDLFWWQIAIDAAVFGAGRVRVLPSGAERVPPWQPLIDSGAVVVMKWPRWTRRWWKPKRSRARP